MSLFFEKRKSKNWFFASYLAETRARANDDFNMTKTNYISEMLKMKNLEDFKGFKQHIDRHIKEAKVMRFINIIFDIRDNDIFYI